MNTATTPSRQRYGQPFVKHPKCKEESSKSLIIYNQLSPETESYLFDKYLCRRKCKVQIASELSVEKESYWIETCFVAGEYARRLTVLMQFSVETESYWLETDLYHENMPSG